MCHDTSGYFLQKSFSLAGNALVASYFLKTSVAANQAFESDTQKQSV